MALEALNLLPDPRPVIMNTRLSIAARSHTLRCDAKQAERRFRDFDQFIRSVPHYQLGGVLPKSFVKGKQPQYLESIDPAGIPVVSTLAIQDLQIQVELCRYIADEDYQELEDERIPKMGDVLLTMDGGPSIGKPALFDLEGDYAVDSHIAILRPVGLSPQWLVYLLASPLGQVQFQRAESGASGQTGVTEDDVRRFLFPSVSDAEVSRIVALVDQERSEARRLIAEAERREEVGWQAVVEAMTRAHKKQH